MTPNDFTDRDSLQRLLGAQSERIRLLEQELAEQHRQHNTDAREWQRLKRHQRDLAEWLVDQATNSTGIIVASSINAALKGEAFVPCSFDTFQNNRRYRLDLCSTEYSIREILANG